jgi:hypothetical protein
MRWPLLPLGMMIDGDRIPEVAPEHEEHSRQLRRISEFNNRRKEKYEREVVMRNLHRAASRMGAR